MKAQLVINSAPSQRGEKPCLLSIAPTSLQLVEPGVRYLHDLGPRVLAEFLIAMAEPVGELRFLLCQLNAYRLVTPELLRATGGDQFPRSIYMVAGGRAR